MAVGNKVQNVLENVYADAIADLGGFQTPGQPDKATQVPSPPMVRLESTGVGGDGGRSPQEEVRQESVEAVAAKPHQVKDSKNPDDLPPRIDAQMRPVGPPARRLENIERDLHLQRNLMS